MSPIAKVSRKFSPTKDLGHAEWAIGRSGDPSRQHTPKEVTVRWKANVTKRLKMDVAGTASWLKNKALPEETVLETWDGLVKQARGGTTESWIHRGVLVGTLDLEEEG